MKILVFDTETTGLIPKGIALTNVISQPYIVQLSYILFDTDENKVLVDQNVIISLPKNIRVSKESTKIHGITQRTIQQQGISILPVLQHFHSVCQECDLLVAHNIEFDKKMIIIEGLRNDWHVAIPTAIFCTMKNTIDLCKIIRKNYKGEPYYKYPRLCELHQFLFGKLPTNLHNAYIDILICLRCFYKLYFQTDILQKNKYFKKQLSLCL